MNLPAESGDTPEASQIASSQANQSALQADFPGSIFLMINSLETGGTERQYVELARSLIETNLDVHLGCLQKKGVFPDDLGTFHHFGLGGSLFGQKSMRSRWRLMRYLREYGVAVAHAFDFYTNLTLIPAARLARVPAVIGSHRQLGDLLTSSQFHAQLTAFRGCDRVVCNSHAAADRLLQSGLPGKKLVVIGNALPPAVFAQTTPALPRQSGVLQVGMIARMNAAYKNHAGFLRAAAALCRKIPETEFILVGDGPLRANLEREAAELGLRDRVRFLGDRSDIPSILSSLDVSVIPSISESLSNVMLESMAAGVPVVATAVGGNTELGSDGRAVLVPANDDDALAAGMERVLVDQNFASAMSREAREFAQANFSVEQIRKRYFEVYSEVLSSTGRVDSRSKGDAKPSANGRIRVALVAPTLRYVGGQAVQADLLMRNWKNDPDVEARFLPVDPILPGMLRWVEQVPLLRTLVREPLYLVYLWRTLSGVDVAHMFSASYSSFLLAPFPAWVVARMRSKKTLINYRSGECRDHLQKSRLARYVLRNTDKLVVPSGYLVDVLGEFGLKAGIVPNLVDLSQFSYRPRMPLRPHLVCTRGFHPYYGVDVVVRAFAEVQESFPNAQLDLVGSGPLEKEIRRLVAHMNLSGVNFLGVASRSEIGRFYDRADIFVNGSNMDNMPVSVLEAFAAGTPVVTTAPKGIRYIVEHERTGLLSEVGEASTLAKNIIRVLNDPELAQNLARNASEESVRYSWNAVREQWLEVYTTLTQRRRKPEGALAGIA
jgi:glycosyltransferase involved in cell wall biosynthesis